MLDLGISVRAREDSGVNTHVSKSFLEEAAMFRERDCNIRPRGAIASLNEGS